MLPPCCSHPASAGGHIPEHSAEYNSERLLLAAALPVCSHTAATWGVFRGMRLHGAGSGPCVCWHAIVVPCTLQCCATPHCVSDAVLSLRHWAHWAWPFSGGQVALGPSTCSLRRSMARKRAYLAFPQYTANNGAIDGTWQHVHCCPMVMPSSLYSARTSCLVVVFVPGCGQLLYNNAATTIDT
jgi:hypothetical protein